MDKDIKRLLVYCVNSFLVAGILGTTFGIIDCNQEKNLKNVNDKIAADLEMKSFDAKSIIIDRTNENALLHIYGSATDVKNNILSLANADYSVSGEDADKLIEKFGTVASSQKLTSSILKNLLVILNRSAFIGGTSYKSSFDNETVFNFSKPETDEKSNTVSYNVTLAQLDGDKNLTLETFRISAPMDKKLKKNPQEIYSKPVKNCEVKILESKEIKNVEYVEMRDGYTLTI